MGEIAEMMLDGLLDEETGEFIDGEAPGYPRRMSEMHQSERAADKPSRSAKRRAARRRAAERAKQS